MNKSDARIEAGETISVNSQKKRSCAKVKFGKTLSVNLLLGPKSHKSTNRKANRIEVHLEKI